MFNRKKIETKSKFKGRFFLSLFILLLIIPIFLKPLPAQAQFTDPTGWPRTIYQTIKDYIINFKDRIWQITKDSLKVAGDISFKNSLKTFYGQVTQDTAVWLSSAGSGQSPLFITNPSYWMDLSDSVAGDTISTLGEKVFGNYISEPDLNIKLMLTASLNKVYNPTTWCQDKCDAGYQAKINQAEELYHGDVKLATLTREGETAMYPSSGLITYFERYSSEINFPDFESMHAGDNFFCPVYCPDTGSQPIPGTICNNAQVAKNATEATMLPINLDNVKGCYNTLVNCWTKDSQEANDERRICLNDCKEGKTEGKSLASNAFKNIKNLGDPNAVNELVNIYLSPEENEIGQMLTLYGIVEEKIEEEVEKKEVIMSGDQLGAITGPVPTEILSPREAVKSRLETAFGQATDAESTYTGSIQADLVSFFSKSLIGNLFDKFFGGKCALNPNAEGCTGPTGGSKLSQIVFGGGGRPSGIAAAKLYFASISKINFSRGNPGQNEIDSGNLSAKGIISASIQTAIDQNMTVGQAIEKGLIGGIFGFDSEGREPTIDSGIPYWTIVYLRNYRVVPVGWELAAKWIKENPQNITLEELAFNEYEKCRPGGRSTCSNDSSRECTGNSDCRDYSLCPDGNCSSDQICVTEVDGGPAACYDYCDDSTPCPDGSSCYPSPGSLGPISGYCVGDNQPHCQYEAKASPFCGLVDPDWVLKMPATYCEKIGASEEIISKEYICSEDTNEDGKIDCSGDGDNYDIGGWQITRNSDTCVDEVACLKEDSEGRCLKYGYCFEERPSWKFDGEECSRQYVSCQSMEKSDGREVSYLLNTVDYNGCDVTNAGCRWHCREPSFDSSNNNWTCTRDSGDKIHFDRDVEECAEAEVGCQEFIRFREGTNMVRNASFEYYTGEVDDNTDDAWEQVWIGNGTPPYSCGATAKATSDAYAGAIAVKLEALSNDCSASDTGRYLAFTHIDTGHSVLNRTFTISFYAKASNACAMRTSVKNGQSGAWADRPIIGGPFNLTIEWQRYSYTATFGESNIGYDVNGVPVNPNEILAMFRANHDCAIYLDAVQVEEEGLTNYKDYGSANLVYLNQTRTSCPTDDVGCEKYTPTKGGTSIPGVVYNQNRCSADKVGCQVFREIAIENIPLRPEQDPVYFVAGTGTRCSAASVGCEEYTNLEAVVAGGEGKEYYKQIRQCVKPEAPEVATYYTWEGSDVSGYQLRAFRLKKSNMSDAPCTNLEIAGVATENPACVDAADTIAVCSASEMAYNPDCTEYYDANANVFYRLRSRVIEATGNCKSYRNTVDSRAGSDNIYYLDSTKSIKCSASQAGCREYKGNTGEVVRPVFEDDFEDSAVAASNWASGILSNESLRANERSLKVSISTGTNPAILAGKLMQGQEYYLTFWLKPETATEINNIVIQNSPPSGEESPIRFIASSITLTQDWNRYRFGPLRFNRLPMEYEQLAIETNGSFFLDNVLLEEVSDTTHLIKNTFVSCRAGDLGCQEYKDRGGKTHYIKSFNHLCAERNIGCEAMANTQNSKYPFTQTIKGVTVPADTVEAIVYDPAKNCPARAKGCQRFGLPNLDIFNEPQSWITRYLINDPDKYDYWGSERDLSIICLAENEGCDEYTHKNGGGVSWFKDPRTKTCEFKIVPGEYQEYQWYKSGTSSLCPVTTPPIEGQPVGRACVRACRSGTDYAGQACVSHTDCYALNTSLTVSETACGGTPGSVGQSCEEGCPTGYICDYWVGLCPDNQSGCNEYRDPSDPDGCRSTCSLEEAEGRPVPLDDECNPTVCDGGINQGKYCYSDFDCPGSTCVGNGIPGCRSYYYIRQTVEENRAECGNMVNFEEGCLPFNDTSNPELNMRGL